MDSNLPPGDSPPPPPVAPTAPPAPPPLNRPPPVISPVPAPRRSRTGTGWKVFAIILVVLLALSLLLNMRHAVSGVVNLRNVASHESGPRLEEAVMKDLNSDNKIAVIDIDGIITGEASEDSGGYSMVEVIKEQLRLAKKDTDVKAVILRVDSPGGEVLASDEISTAIRQFQAKSGKPVIVSMGSLAASGGYYVSAPCEFIVANELTITGSIGVIMHGFNYRGLLDKIGVEPEVYKSGKFKDMMSGTREPAEVSPEEKQMIQSLIDETYDKFKTVVADGRHASFQLNQKQGQPLSPDWADYADGRILSGKEAFRLGFVDDLGDFDTAVKHALDLAHVKNANLVQYQQSFDISSIFHLFGQSNARAMKVDIGVEIPKLRAGYLYFLSPTYLH
jgi:protease-4